MSAQQPRPARVGTTRAGSRLRSAATGRLVDKGPGKTPGPLARQSHPSDRPRADEPELRAATPTPPQQQRGTLSTAAWSSHGVPADQDIRSQDSFASSALSSSTDSPARGPSQVETLEAHLAGTLTSVRAIAAHHPRGLPVAQLPARTRSSSSYYAVTTVDNRGRLADRSPLRVLGWPAETPISITVVQALIVIVARDGGTEAITRQGHLRLPAAVRHRCRLDPGARLLLAAWPERDLLLACTAAALDAVLLPYHASLEQVRR